MQLLRRIKRGTFGAVWLFTGMLVTGTVGAVEVPITATFKSNHFRPGHDQFVDTSKPGGFCLIRPSLCAPLGVRTADVPISFTRTVMNNNGNRDDGFLAKVPAERVVSVTNDQGASFSLTLKFTHVSQQLYVASSTGSLQAPTRTAYVLGGCDYVDSRGSGVTPIAYNVYLWRVTNPTTPGVCYPDNSVELPDNPTQEIVIQTFGVGYQLITPSPLLMASGVYRGSTDFTAGETAGDFMFGSGSGVSDTVTFTFELTVQHDFKVEFPPDGQRAVLEPPGGWRSFIDSGIAPKKLQRETYFKLWSSGSFRMYLECEYDLAGRCGISNTQDSSDTVAMDVFVTLPGKQLSTGGMVRKYPLNPGDNVGGPRFESLSAIHNQRASLLFEVGSASDVANMVAKADAHYRGRVTVVFDENL